MGEPGGASSPTFKDTASQIKMGSAGVWGGRGSEPSRLPIRIETLRIFVRLKEVITDGERNGADFQVGKLRKERKGKKGQTLLLQPGDGRVRFLGRGSRALTK